MSFSPNLGRWIQDDPIGFEAGDPNLVRYEGNNPTNELDAMGLESAPFDQSVGSVWLPRSSNWFRGFKHADDKLKILETNEIGLWTKRNPVCPLPAKTKPIEVVGIHLLNLLNPHIPGACLIPPRIKLNTVIGGKGWSGVIPEGVYIGPRGCASCVGVALLPPKKGMKVYILHLTANQRVTSSFITVGFAKKVAVTYSTALGDAYVSTVKVIPNGYQAVICGAIQPQKKNNPTYNSENQERLDTLEEVVLFLRKRKVQILGYIASSGFVVDENNDFWWSDDPTSLEGDRYQK